MLTRSLVIAALAAILAVVPLSTLQAKSKNLSSQSKSTASAKMSSGGGQSTRKSSQAQSKKKKTKGNDQHEYMLYELKDVQVTN